MFSFFKPSYYLKEVMPEHYIDIHNHLLVNLEEKNPSENEIQTRISQMKTIGILSAIASPATFNGQLENDAKQIQTVYDETIKFGTTKNFIRGFAIEYLINRKLVTQAKKEPLHCIVDRFLLVELPLNEYPIDMYASFFELHQLGYTLILAHPERHPYFHSCREKYREIKEFGVLFQLNLLSLLGYYGKEVQQNTYYLLDEDLYDFSGTEMQNIQELQYLEQTKIRYPEKKKIISLLQHNLILWGVTS